MFKCLVVVGVLSTSIFATTTLRAADATPAEFFEKKIRPVFVENCQECHGAKRQKSGIRLDRGEKLTIDTGGKGPILIPFKPDESRLIRAIRHEGEIHMPQGGKLSDAAIADLVAWVKMGAPWPETKQTLPIADAARKHWAFLPVANPSLPAIENSNWSSSPLDRFVLARLEANRLSPSGPTDKRTLIRRTTFDLTGLPPTPSEIDAYLKDDSPNAYEKVVDRLLESTAYGERWARHWLDLARYSDTKGYVDAADPRQPFAYSYRDWVIRAFNSDLPYDRFVIEQIAADLLPHGNDNRDLAALGFLTLGRRFEENEPDLIDDRLDVITRGLLGLTVTCARCHDHKYDPIPTRDYYSLYGVFSGTKDREVPIWASQAERRAYLIYARDLRSRQRERDEFLHAHATARFGPVRRQVDRYLLAATAEKDKLPAEGEKRTDGLHQQIVDRWKNALRESPDEFHPILTPWREIAQIPDTEFAEKTKALALKFARNKNQENRLNPLVAEMFDGEPPASLEEVAKRYGKLFASVENRFRAKIAKAADDDEAPPTGLTGSEEVVRAFLYGDDSPTTVPADELVEMLSDEEKERLNILRTRVDELRNSESAPPHAIALTDPDEPVAPQVFLRGKPDNPGEEVPRQFLSILSGRNRKPFPNGTGRLDLAKAIASKSNPLTARVWVNRVWMHHFGDGLVRTPSDFGLRSEPSSHPELLDYLADRFMADGWSTKRLHRLILLSKTYRQASADRPECRAIDAENRLLWRMGRRRLEFESLRDSMLVAAGTLDDTPGGRSVDLAEQPLSGRRTIYLRIDRSQLPAEFRAFDFANPDMHSPKRHETIVPQQSLYLMNSPFVAQQARSLAAKIGDERLADKDWIDKAHRLLYGRAATAKELERGLKFLGAANKLGAQGPSLPTIWQYGRGRWDEKAKKLIDFQPFAHFQDGMWRGGPEYPDPKLSYLALNAEGGHPGDDLSQVAVRRWIAPADGRIAIESSLGQQFEEEDPEADGVRGQIVFKTDVLLSKTAFKNESPMKLDNVRVKKGDQIDFIVDCRKNSSNDSFTWPALIHLSGSDMDGRRSFSSKDDFEGPPEPVKPLSAREKLAQVLLMANEFSFVD